MDNNRIIELFFERNEAALSELSRKYGGYFGAIAERIVCNREDAMTCVNDAYFRAWNTIPPARPNKPKPFVGKLVKCAAVSMLRADAAKKRGGGLTQQLFIYQERHAQSDNEDEHRRDRLEVRC